jgi:5'-3' exonuclease
VQNDRVVQIDRRRNEIRDEEGVRAKFGVAPEYIPDYLALVGDSADGFPGISGYGPRTAARLINQYGTIESFPPEILGKNIELALLFKDLATLRADAALFKKVDELEWRGPQKSFRAIAEKIEDPKLAERVSHLAKKRKSG